GFRRVPVGRGDTARLRGVRQRAAGAARVGRARPDPRSAHRHDGAGDDRGRRSAGDHPGTWRRPAARSRAGVATGRCPGGALVWTEIVGEDDATSAIAALVEDQRMSVWAAVAMFVYLWLVGPVCEELIYRGLLWGAVERLQWKTARWGRLAAFLVSTAVFAASHLEPMRTALLLVIAVPIGLARLRTGRLLASIVAHQVNNFLPAVAILLTSLGILQV